VPVGTVEATEGRQEMTKAGKRSATMRRITLTAANTTGACQIAVRVDNVTQELLVAVSSPPEPPGLR
jgi:hypothetical protein